MSIRQSDAEIGELRREIGSPLNPQLSKAVVGKRFARFSLMSFLAEGESEEIAQGSEEISSLKQQLIECSSMRTNVCKSNYSIVFLSSPLFSPYTD